MRQLTRPALGNGLSLPFFAAGLLCLLVTVPMVTVPMPAHAHETRPGYLEIKETEPNQYDVLFKVPRYGSDRLQMYAVFPESCSPLRSTATYITPTAFLERTTVTCAQGLIGQTLGIEGLEVLFTDVLVRIEPLEGAALTHRLVPSRSSFVVPEAVSAWEVAGIYLALGVDHILGGVDHLLFVLALLLLARGFKLLFKTITAFTVAHSLTLALAALGVLNVPGAPVEAVIALSILFLACEIVRTRGGQIGLTARYPWVVAFTFGLLHGLGFAGALAEVGLPETAIPLALLFFNVGVEVGQLLFVVASLVVVDLIRRLRVAWPAWSVQVIGYGIGSVAAFWCAERVAAFW